VIWTVVDAIKEVPLELSTRVGDVVHNFRSSLDHLVFELAFLGEQGRRIPERTAFPASETRANWRSDYVQHTLLAGVMAKHKAVLYRAQPCYRRRDSTAATGRSRSPMAELHHLWTEDKHRLMQLMVVAPQRLQWHINVLNGATRTGPVRINREILGRPLEVGTKVCEFPIQRAPGAELEVDMSFNVGAAVCLQNGFPVTYALIDIGRRVQQLVEGFEATFETKQARRLWGVSRGGWIEEESLVRRSFSSI
jgi:hypothetical protein